jgi:hypothetical protein
MASITVDFSNVPSDVALLLSQQENTERLARDLARTMRLPDPERQFIHDELVGVIAEVIDGHLEYATRPKPSE